MDLVPISTHSPTHPPTNVVGVWGVSISQEGGVGGDWVGGGREVGGGWGWGGG